MMRNETKSVSVHDSSDNIDSPVFTGWISSENCHVQNQTPEVDVIPSEAHIGQQVLVKAKINIAVC